MIVYQSKDACIIHIEKRNYAYLAIEGFFDSSRLKDFSLKVIELCRTKGVSKLLFDVSKITVIKSEDIEWLQENIVPKLKNAESNRYAIVCPENQFGLISVNRILSYTDKNKFKFFPNIERAEDWLFKSVNISS
jgi:hypothetical protein